MTDGLVAKLHRLAGANDERLGTTPDVIAHSLGTWLLGHALTRNRDLQVGRVILAGSILRPDFDWAALRASGQVEQVLNHRGDHDRWVPIAHYVISDSGPSGTSGFLCPGVIERVATGFGHSDFFGEQMSAAYSTAWRPFLTLHAAETVMLANTAPTSTWRSAPWPLRATVLPLALLVLLVAVALLLSVALVVGLATII
jgi:serine/threonine-protein kinase